MAYILHTCVPYVSQDERAQLNLPGCVAWGAWPGGAWLRLRGWACVGQCGWAGGAWRGPGGAWLRVRTWWSVVRGAWLGVCGSGRVAGSAWLGVPWLGVPGLGCVTGGAWREVLGCKMAHDWECVVGGIRG